MRKFAKAAWGVADVCTRLHLLELGRRHLIHAEAIVVAVVVVPVLLSVDSVSNAEFDLVFLGCKAQVNLNNRASTRACVCVGVLVNSRF